MKRNIAILTVLPFLIFLSGCINLSPNADPSRFYLLTADASCGKECKDIGLSPVQVPEYLSKPYMAKRVGSEIKYNQIDRWAEPLKVNIERVLGENLSAGIPPWPANYEPSNKVSVVIHDFILENESVVLVANWQVNKGKLECFKTCVALTKSSVECMVEAMNQALFDLSQAIESACY